MKEKAFMSPEKCLFTPDGSDLTYIRAGPRIHNALRSKDVKIAITTSGGLCPGLNVVLRELVMSSWYNYGVRKIFGIKWGYEGITNQTNWMELTPNDVHSIHREGGTIMIGRAHVYSK